MDSSIAPSSIAAPAIARLLASNPSSSSSSSSSFSPYSAYAFSSTRAMATAVVIVFIVLLLALMFRIYAKWFMNHSSGDVHRSSNMNAAAGGSASAASAACATGLDKIAIDSLPVFTVAVGKCAAFSKRDLQNGLEAAMASSSDALDDCAVCLSEFAEGETGRLLPRCRHSFHTECIDMWFHTHSTCPLCRTAVVETEEAGIGSAPSPSSSPHEIAVAASGSMAMATPRSGQEQSRVTPISTSEEEEEEQQQQHQQQQPSGPPSQPVSTASASHVAIDVQ
jgi:hypothetical protein